MTSFMHKPNVAGQSIVDRALAAKHTVSGSGVAKVVCKATTEEVMAPKRKHLDYLLHCTNDSNVSIPHLANLLIDRTQNTSWVVVFKALVTMHNLMNYGNERFTQYLASNNCHLNLANFTDRGSNLGYSMSAFVRRYARYLNQKASSYRTMAFDFCKVKRGKEDGMLRTMNTEKLLKALPVVHSQLEALVEFEVDVNDLSNGVINGCFMLMFKDLIRLFACYNDGIINLLEKYFDMNKKQCKDALDIYKKFIARTDRVCQFLKVAENVGIDKGDIPDLAKAPSSLLEALESHLNSLENTKKPGTTSASSTAAAAPAPRPAAGVTTVINTYKKEAERGVAPGAGASLTDISDQERAQILEEEQRQLELMRQRRMNQEQQQQRQTASQQASLPPSSSSVLSSQPTSTNTGPSINNVPQSFIDFVDNYNFSSKHADELLALDAKPAASNSFAAFGSSSAYNGFESSAANGSAFNTAANNPFMASSSSGSLSTATQDFGQPWPSSSNNDFIVSAHVTNTGSSKDLDLFAGSASNSSLSMMQPMTLKPAGMGGAVQGSSPSYLSPARTANSAPMSPINSGTGSSGVAETGNKDKKLIKANDIDNSLANLAGNLNVSSGYLKKSEHQWKGDPGEKKLTGGPAGSGSAWTSNMGTGAGVNWNQPSVAPGAQMSVYPSMQTVPAAYPMYGGGMAPQPMMGGPAMGAYGVPMGAPVMVMGGGSMGWPAQQFPTMPPATTQLPPQQQQQQSSFANDPFGAL